MARLRFEVEIEFDDAIFDDAMVDADGVDIIVERCRDYLAEPTMTGEVIDETINQIADYLISVEALVEVI